MPSRYGRLRVVTHNRRGHYSSARAGHAAGLDLLPCRSSLCAHLGWAYRVPPWPRSCERGCLLPGAGNPQPSDCSGSSPWSVSTANGRVDAALSATRGAPCCSQGCWDQGMPGRSCLEVSVSRPVTGVRVLPGAIRARAYGPRVRLLTVGNNAGAKCEGSARRAFPAAFFFTIQ